jgi:hypothetical protein
MDTSRYARFTRPGHRVTGDRSHKARRWMHPDTRVGYEYAHAIVDDHSRLAYVELHPDEKAVTVTGFVERALAFFADPGIDCKRVMTDNGFSYTKNRDLADLLAHHGIATSPPSPTDPAPTARSSASTRPWPANGHTDWPTAHTTTATPRCHTGSTTTTGTRPHSSIGDRPPISRIHNVCGVGHI